MLVNRPSPDRARPGPGLVITGLRVVTASGPEAVTRPGSADQEPVQVAGPEDGPGSKRSTKTVTGKPWTTLKTGPEYQASSL